ncbi:MAG: response regulator [Chloroflexota bacterium]|nr:response regulator [Chloroflexota bacterium]
MTSRSHHSPLRVLAIEDSPEVRGFYGALLAEEGYAVKLACNGEEGLSVLSWEPDVILLDLLLPVMDGYEFLRRLRASPDGQDVPVLVLSGSLSPTRMTVRGAQAVLRKPFDFGYLMRSIQVLAMGGIAPSN